VPRCLRRDAGGNNSRNGSGTKEGDIMIRWLQQLSAFVAAFSICAAALAQTAYPAKPVVVIVPYAPGQGTDVLARIVAQKLQEALGQPFVVENKPGAGGNIGTEAAAKAAPDGYTIVMGTNATHAANAAMYPKLSFDHLKDFAPISLVGMIPMVLSSSPSYPASSLKELIAAAKQKPGDINVALPSTTAQVVLEQLQQMSGAKFFPVTYKGSGAAFTDVAGGRIPLLIDTVTASLPQISGGKLKAIAITTASRAKGAPNIPTVAESGVPGFELVAWNALYAPRDTPQAIIAKLNGEVMRLLAQPETKQRLLQMGFEPVGGTPQQLAAFTETETKKWGALINAAGLKAQ
jgi:tripartite-type tricarboxylate transporter receptor subunit TctC